MIGNVRSVYLEDVLWRAGHRPPVRVAALDGLRAIAVVAVVAYHLDVSVGGLRLARGGFVGVDLFFVLSGFLIGSLAQEEIRCTGRVDVLAFWGRRFRRLMPASLTLLVCVVAWSALVGWGRDIRVDVVGSVYWFQNWHLVATGQSYVEQFVAPSPLRHFWSLSIEEQWYLAFPLLALLARRWVLTRRVVVAAVLLVGAFVSAMLMAVFHDTGSGPWRSYFGTDTRIFALLIGCAAAMLPSTNNEMSSPETRRAWGWVMLGGLGLWFVMAWTVSEQADYMYLGGFMAVSLISACAVVGAAKSRVRWFDPAPIQWLGSRSYGIYLWHWPVLVALTQERTGLHGALLALARCTVTAVATEISYRWIEQPVRLRRQGPLTIPRLVVPVGLAASLGAATIAITMPTRFDRGGAAEVLRRAQQPPTANPAPAGDSGSLAALVVGDSVAFGLGYLPAMGDSGKTLSSMIQLTNGGYPGCGLTRLARPDSTYLVGDKLADCLALADRWQEQLAAGPDVVVWVVGPWDSVDVLDGADTVEAGTEQWTYLINRRLGESFDVLTSTDAPLVVVLPPCRSVAPKGLMGLTPESISALADVITLVAARYDNRVHIEDPSSWVCPTIGPQNRTAKGGPIRDDGLHYTADGKLEFWRWLTPLLDVLV